MLITEAKVRKLGESKILSALNPDSPIPHYLAELDPRLEGIFEADLSSNAATTIFRKWITVQTELLKLDRGGKPSWNRITRAVREALRAFLNDSKETPTTTPAE